MRPIKESPLSLKIGRLARLRRLVRHHMFLPIIAGLAMRLAIAPWTEQRWDSYINRLIGAYVYGYGINPLIPEKSCSTCLPILNYSYPPVWLYIVLGVFGLWLGLSHYSFPANPASLWSQAITTNNIFEAYRSFMPSYLPALDLLLKTPIIISDLAIGYLIWAIGGKTKKAALVSTTAWILNPYTLLVSTIWGEFDSLAILFMTLATFYILRKNYARSGVALALGVSTKIFPVALLPITLAYILVNQRGQLIRYSAAFVGTTGGLMSTLFLFPHPLEFIERLVLGRATPNMSGTSVYAGLTWMTVFNQISFSPHLPMFLVVFPILTIIVLLTVRHRLHGQTNLIPALALGFLPIYLSYPIVNIQYPLWALPFLSLLTLRKRIGSWCVALVSGIPTATILLSVTPLYSVSPVLIWEENNFPPASDVISQLWSFGTTPMLVGALFFTCAILLILYRLVRTKTIIEEKPTIQAEIPTQAPVPIAA